jgi:tRNA modification GTPase
MVSRETIYALATPQGRSALGVLRMSGPKTADVVAALAGRLPSPRRFQLTALRDPSSGQVLDQAVVIWLPGPASFSGEDCAEFHIHGGSAVLRDLMDSFGQFEGVRMAEAGEFTRRAVANGKMDLVEVEGLADLLGAETTQQRRRALDSMSGKPGKLFDSWRERLLSVRSSIEAAIDFSDEPDVTAASVERVDAEIRELLGDVSAEVGRWSAVQVVRDGMKVVLAGLPNTGKSSLLNALARRDVAIVSAIPGTTRDVLEVRLDLRGHLVILMDTAGLRDQVSDDVEREGVERSRARIDEAEVVVWVGATDIEGSLAAPEGVEPHLVALGKSDLLVPGTRLPRNVLAISAQSGEGINALIDSLAELAAKRALRGEGAVIGSIRQKEAAENMIRLLSDALDPGIRELEVKAEIVRAASFEVERLTGRIDAEEWLGAIFSRFCIGK